MDQDVDARLAAARARAAEREATESRRRMVAIQIAERSATLRSLSARLERERDDVARLERRSFAAMLATVLGTKEERLRTERAEVLRAAAARDTCEAALESLRADESAIDERLWALSGADRELDAAIRAKEADLVARGGPAAVRLAEVDSRTAEARAMSKEIAEAIGAADAAARALDTVLASLESARSWGTFDMLAGGTVSTWIKHSRIDEARSGSHAAQAALDRLRRELSDVRGAGAAEPLVVEIDGFSKFADMWFDNIVTDWMVQKRICASFDNTARVRQDVIVVRSRLDAQLRDLRRATDGLAAERERMLGGS
ncbi:MAG: hypothetical protein K8T90_03655 [Planctomycetes bacterium]|nr:hypothetical protein [Planctomycetota bacterium]